MQPHEFVTDMAWKDLCNRRAEARQQHDAAVEQGDADAAERAALKLHRVTEELATREAFLLTGP